MSETVLVAESGRPTGSAAARRLRREDSIPAVVYGHGMEPLSISVARRDLRLALSGPAGLNTVLDLTVDGSVYPAIVKDLQRHPVRRTVQHVDFLQVNLDEAITLTVPVRLEGEAKAVEHENGFVDLVMNDFEVTTTPRNIPDEIVVDITDFTMDSIVTVADIALPAGVTATADPELPVVTVIAMHAEPAEGEAAEGEAVAEAEAEAEVEAAEGGAAEGGDEAAGE